MSRLKARHKLTLQLAVTTFVLMAAMGALFTLVAYLHATQAYRDSLKTEADDIAEDYLGSDGSRIIYQDKSGNQTTLTNHLRESNSSALVFNINHQLLGAFGAFETAIENNQLPIETDTNAVSLTSLNTILERVIATGKYEFNSHLYAGLHELVVLSYPIQASGKTIGVLQLGKSSTLLSQTLVTELLILLSALPLALLLSVLVAAWLSRSAFGPIHQMRQSINQISSLKVNKHLTPSGHEDDDLTQLALAFNAMMDRLKQSSARQKDFVGNASHELKTPLTKAISTLDLALSETHHPELELVKSDLLDMNHLIEALLFLAHADDLSLQQQNGPTDLSSAIDKILQRLAPDIEPKHLQIITTNIPQVNMAMGKVHLDLLLSNLLSNAVKYSLAQTAITVTAIVSANKLQLSVQDHGIGMDKTTLDHVFERFYRAPKAKQQSVGSGLGLSIVQAIATVYGLTLQVESTLDLGTTITVMHIPLAPVTAPQKSTRST